jgi:hypothetical protein
MIFRKAAVKWWSVVAPFSMEEKMAKFAAYEVKAGGAGVWINLDLVTRIVPSESRATLHFVDGSTISVDCPADQVADHANDR